MKFSLIILVTCAFISCAKTPSEEVSQAGFNVLSYDAKISETLNLNTENIVIDKPKEVNFWSQDFQNPKNDLNNLYSAASFKKKDKLISGKKGPLNIIQPIYFNQYICYLLSNGFLECLDSLTKDRIFSIDIKPEDVEKYEVIRGGIAYFDGQITFADAYGQIILINAKSGAKIWSNKIDFPILSSPFIYRGYIYLISADNRIFSIDISNGEIDWSFQTISETKKNLYTSSPVAYENTIIVPFSNGELISFIYNTGQPVWSENVSKISLVSNFDIKDISASPIISDNTIYSVSTKGKLVSVNALSGKRNWSLEISGYRTPIASGNQIYIINDEAQLICIDKESGDIYWITDLNKYRKGQKVENLNLWLGPYLINNLLYNISYFGELKIISPVTGEILSEENIGVNGVMVPPLILNDAIFVTDKNLNVYRFK